MTSHYIIKGIPPVAEPGQPVPLRLDVNDWFLGDHGDSSIQISLFVRALRIFMAIPYTETDSYYQIAGIHGFPYSVPWDNTPDLNPDDDDPNKKHSPGFYCPHGEYRFPTWHRPYMLLFEQRIWEIMKTVVNNQVDSRITDADVIKLYLNIQDQNVKNQWEAVMNRWRLPFWDWARHDSTHPYGLPAICLQQYLDIVKPGTTDKDLQVLNPLWAFPGDGLAMGDESRGDLAIENDPPGPDASGTLPWKHCIGTSRYAVQAWPEHGPKPSWVNGLNNYTAANVVLTTQDFYNPVNPNDVNPNDNPLYPQLKTNNLSDKVYRMFTYNYLKTWDEFATTKGNNVPLNDPSKAGQDWQSYLSLEFIHNNLHNWIGGTSLTDGCGHMSDVPVAAFDPIFYLHHCNIDRLLAIWQTLNQDQWISEDQGSTIKLYPFRYGQSDNEIYLSNDVRDWLKLGYQYELLHKHTGESQQQYMQRINDWLKNTYNIGASQIVEHGHKLKAILPTTETSGVSTQQVQLAQEETGPGSAQSTSAYKYHDFIIDVLYDRHGYDGGRPYTIHFFIGHIEDSEIKTLGNGIENDPRQVGSVFTFSAKLNDETTIRCSTCAKQVEEGAISQAQIPLTTELLHRALDKSIEQFNYMNLDAVKSYLAENLSWKAVSISGDVIPHDQLSRTKVFVLSGEATHETSQSDGSHPISTYGNYTFMLDVTAG